MEEASVFSARAVLRWHVEMGVDEAVSDAPANWFARQPQDKAEASLAKRSAIAAERPAAPVSSIAPAPPVAADEAMAAARRAARDCASLAELAKAIAAFEGCALKSGARSTVVYDGTEGAALLVIGEAPGREEDAAGKPFVGRAGQLLDRMLAAIGRSRSTNTLISNVVFWRPPGNRTPTQAEIAICLPFVLRLIAITRPKAVLLAGGAPLQALAGVSGIMRARGSWREVEVEDLDRPVAMMPMFHPAFLLRQPAHKRLAWRDLVALDARLRDD